MEFCPVFEICGEVVAGRWFHCRATPSEGRCRLLGHLVRENGEVTWEKAEEPVEA